VSRFVLPLALVAWFGLALVLTEIRWFRRPTLAARLRPYVPATTNDRGRATAAVSLREVVGPLAQQYGARLARAFGVKEETAHRLERVHSPLTVSQFRVRQFGWAGVGFVAAAVTTLALALPPAVALLFLVGAPALVFLIVEQRLASASNDWQRRLLLELPVVAEQLGMLLSAGYSLGGALNRIGMRGHGACGSDLRRVGARIRHGLSDIDALREWSQLADVDALSRLVGVLALNREAGDLGQLISEEARTIRREVHRQLIETIERRSQQVWIPVTVATLLPGVLFLAVPFIEAMRLFTTE
jgi:Flp pilus assembly protein TadB